MTTYDNTNRGVLFDNDRKEQDTHPDMTGTINIDGVDHWFSGWWKEGQRGEFLSLSIGKPKEARREQGYQREPEPQQQRRGSRPSNSAPQQRAPQGRSGGFAEPQRRAASSFDDMDDDIPFVSGAFSCDMTTRKARRMSRYDY